MLFFCLNLFTLTAASSTIVKSYTVTKLQCVRSDISMIFLVFKLVLYVFLNSRIHIPFGDIVFQYN